MKKVDQDFAKTRLLWLDLEMTGLDNKSDLILEIACLVTDWQFEVVDQFRAVVKHDDQLLLARLKNNHSFWQANPLAKQALTAQNACGESLAAVEKQILRFIKKNFGASKDIILAGNSVHIDRGFIINNWPKFNKRLHYRMLDVTAWKVVFEGKYGIKFQKPDAHRADEDILGSIEELKYYLAKNMDGAGAHENRT